MTAVLARIECPRCRGHRTVYNAALRKTHTCDRCMGSGSVPAACTHRWRWVDSRNAFVCLNCGEVDDA